MNKSEELLLDNGYEGITYFTGNDFSYAIIGVSNDDRCCYSFEKLVECLVRDGATEDEAVELVFADMELGGDGMPIIVYPLIRFDTEEESDMKVRYCNVCGKQFDKWDENNNCSINTKAGYGSDFDGSKVELDICCECMDKLIKSCKISPVIES